MGICVEISGLLSLLENKVASKHHSNIIQLKFSIKTP